MAEPHPPYVTRQARLGVHYIGPGAFVSLQQAVRSCDLPFALIVNEDKAATWLRQNSPRTIIGFRVTGRDWGANAAKVYDLLPLLLSVPADYFSIANEWMPDRTPQELAAACQGYIEAIDAVKPYGIKLMVGDLNTGHPDMLIPGMYNAMKPMLRKAQAGGHALNIHVYLQGGSGGDPVIWQQIALDFPGLDIIIGELGVLENDGAMTHEKFQALLEYAGKLSEAVVGAALYTLTDQTWRQCDFSQWLDEYAAHVRSYSSPVSFNNSDSYHSI